MSPQQVPWTARALPATIWIQDTPPDGADPLYALPAAQLKLLDVHATRGFVIALDGQRLGIALGSEPVGLPAALLPLDRLFEVRAQSALRLRRALSGLAPGASRATLSAARRDRLLLTLRALDGHSAEASYREIAAALFGRRAIPKQSWKTHDLRDRTIRLVRYGHRLIHGGYRSLLLYPYRGRPRRHDGA